MLLYFDLDGGMLDFSTHERRNPKNNGSLFPSAFLEHGLAEKIAVWDSEHM